MSEPKEHWQLDKRVPLALILAIIVQTGGIAWWAANISKEQEVAAAERVALAVRLSAVENNQSSGNDRLTRLETQMEALKDDTGEILTILRGR